MRRARWHCVMDSRFRGNGNVSVDASAISINFSVPPLLNLDIRSLNRITPHADFAANLLEQRLGRTFLQEARATRPQPARLRAGRGRHAADHRERERIHQVEVIMIVGCCCRGRRTRSRSVQMTLRSIVCRPGILIQGTGHCTAVSTAPLFIPHQCLNLNSGLFFSMKINQ